MYTIVWTVRLYQEIRTSLSSSARNTVNVKPKARL